MKKTYVMSDIHGEYDKFINMLNKINFTKSDTLYIIGDIIDRGDDSIKLIKYIMNKKNIILLKGNHEDMMFSSIKSGVYLKEKEEKNENDIIDATIIYLDWIYNGGFKTLEDFKKESKQTQSKILNYLESLDDYKLLSLNNTQFLLIHAGILIPQDKKASLDVLIDSNVQAKMHLYIREDFYNQDNNVDDLIFIVGHTPTHYLNQIIKDMSSSDLDVCNNHQIYKDKNKINIDCGCVSTNGKLGCLCLNNMLEFYI